MAKSKTLQREIYWLVKEKSDKSQLTNDISRLKKGEPIAFVIGFVDFLGCKIDLSQKPFIPTPETEYWVEAAISKLLKKNDKLRILDVFAGSGCIGITLLKHIKDVKVDFAEKDKKFIKQIKINVNLNKINKKRYKIIQSDVFSNIKEKYNYIFANPPYIAKTRRNKIQKSVLDFEPKKALFGGKDGLFYIREFLKEAKSHLKKQGIIYMEFDSPQKKEIAEIFKKSGYKDYKFYRDQFGKWRTVEVSY